MAKKLNETEARNFLIAVWENCVKPVHDGGYRLQGEKMTDEKTQEEETHLYLTVPGLGFLEAFTLQWVVSKEEGLDQEADYVGIGDSITKIPEQHMPYNKLMLNPWDCYDGDKAKKHRHKYIAIMALMMVRGYEVEVFFDDDFSYGISLPCAIQVMVEKLVEEESFTGEE